MKIQRRIIIPFFLSQEKSKEKIRIKQNENKGDWFAFNRALFSSYQYTAQRAMRKLHKLD